MTCSSLAAGLAELDIRAGDCLMTHIAMSSLGLVIGGPRAIVEGLLEVTDGTGTIMMPTYSGDLSDPAEWRHPAVPADRLDVIRDQIPAFDIARTPSRGMGTVAEYFRTYPGVRRSPHPQSSFSALGPLAERLTSEHPLDNRFGPCSPLGRLMEVRGKVALIGAPYDTVSLFHLTQYLVGGGQQMRKSSPVIEDGVRRWVDYVDIDYPVSWFEEGVEMLLQRSIARLGNIGAARCVVFDARAAVDAVVPWRRERGHVPG